MSYKKIGLFVLSAVVAPAAIADLTTVNSYRYLSGGVAFDNNGLASQMKEFDKVKKSSVGGYLQGSYGFDNQLFVEARLGYLGQRQNGYFSGVGYQIPINEHSSFYVLGGISQPNLPKSPMKFREEKDIVNTPSRGNTTNYKKGNINLQNAYITTSTGKITINGEEVDVNTLSSPATTPADKEVTEKEVTVKSKLAPSVELGYKLAVNDQLGLRFAVRCSYDTLTMTTSEKITSKISPKGSFGTASTKSLNYELSATGHYAVTEQLAVEAGYRFSDLPKLGSYKAQASHRGTVGLRYTF